MAALVHNVLDSPAPLYRIAEWADPIEPTAFGRCSEGRALRPSENIGAERRVSIGAAVRVELLEPKLYFAIQKALEFLDRKLCGPPAFDPPTDGVDPAVGVESELEPKDLGPWEELDVHIASQDDGPGARLTVRCLATGHLTASACASYGKPSLTRSALSPLKQGRPLVAPTCLAVVALL
ncbi:MAG: hypothetical protein HY554_19530 [Elusimicrobia bacterium]|nr:hypothetical protein [Elusimicrobiota bacterium]